MQTKTKNNIKTLNFQTVILVEQKIQKELCEIPCKKLAYAIHKNIKILRDAKEKLMKHKTFVKLGELQKELIKQYCKLNEKTKEAITQDGIPIFKSPEDEEAYKIDLAIQERSLNIDDITTDVNFHIIDEKYIPEKVNAIQLEIISKFFTTNEEI